MAVAVFHNRPQGRPRRQKGPGSIAGWVRGWGLGGTPPGVIASTQRPPSGFPIPEIIFEPCRARGGAGGASAPDAPGRQAVRRGGQQEPPDTADGGEQRPADRRGPPPHTACRLETRL